MTDADGTLALAKASVGQTDSGASQTRCSLHRSSVCEALEVRLQDLIQFQKPRFELKRLDPKSQQQLDRLMDKNNEGELTKNEKTRFKALLDEVQRVSLYNAKALVSQKRLRESTSREILAAR